MNNNLSLPPENLLSIHHDGSGRCVLSPSGEPRLGDTVTLRLRAAPEAPIERILLRTCPDGEQHFADLQPEPPGANPAVRWWQAQLRLSMPYTHYRFLVLAGGEAWWYTAAGLQRSLPTDATNFRLLAGYQAPAWARASVFYQIFPDRFADGDPASNVRNGEFNYRELRSTARPWGAPPAAQGMQAMLEFYGGDLQGVMQRLDYLQDLGVNALYLNPIFSAYSNHRYDVTDYNNVDPHLGGNQALADLRQALDERGMRYILDIVPNHCGFMHPWFQEARQDPLAPSAEFFTFHHHPDDYEAWLGVRSLPKLNYRSQKLRDEIYAGPQAVFRRWLRPPYGADGWRIDVANMLGRQGADQLGHLVGSGIRAAVKDENPEAYLLGENFFDGSEQLQGEFLDANMNYSGFTKPLWWWLKGFNVGSHGLPGLVTASQPWPGQDVLASWQAFRAAIPWAITRQQFNLLGSHDTGRIFSQVNHDPQMNRLAAALLMTYPGIPSVYYGDEIGMRGADAHAARACMQWDPAAWDQELRAEYQALIRLRRSAPALLDGGFQELFAAPDTLAYLRDSANQAIVVVAQRGPSAGQPLALDIRRAGLPDGLAFKELFSGRELVSAGGKLQIGSPAPGPQVWVAQGTF